jgi:hypothetical protein
MKTPQGIDNQGGVLVTKYIVHATSPSNNGYPVRFPAGVTVPTNLDSPGNEVDNIAAGSATPNWSPNLNNDVYNPSDRRLKRNLRTIKNPLEKIMKLRGLYFNWMKGTPDHAKSGDTPQLGLMAQDVREVVPEAVVSKNGGDHLGINYASLVSIVIEAVKELNDRVLKLEDAVDTLKSVAEKKV